MMKQTLTLFSVFFLSALFHLSAQNTGDEIFVIDVKIDNQITTYRRGPCGFSAPADWGGPIQSDFCLPIVWGYNASDSLGCDSLIYDYTDKIVMLRRGSCEYGSKALNAQASGAGAVVIANGYGSQHGDACNAPAMGNPEPLPLNIPVVLFCRNLVDVIDNALKGGKHPEVCFRRLSLHTPTAEFAYAVPVAQADTMDRITVGYINRTGMGQEFTAKATITDPAGNITELVTTQFINYPGNSVFHFPEYVPQPLLGKFMIAYSVDQNNLVADTLFREFVLTPHTFATDNFEITGGEIPGLPDPWFFSDYHAASLFKTGDTGFAAKWASFAINNAVLVADPNFPDLNHVNVVLQDADPNDDGLNDLGDVFSNLPFVAYHDFEFNVGLNPDSILTVELVPTGSGPALLKPNHYYYLRLFYISMGSTINYPISFTCSQKVNYTIYNDAGPVTPIIYNSNITPDGWPDATVVIRLHDDYIIPDPTGIKPSPKLADAKFSITPNPAADHVCLNLQLAEQNKTVAVSLIDINGRIVAFQTLRNVQSGQVSFDSSQMPSGYYGLMIRTSEEGAAMTNLMICH